MWLGIQHITNYRSNRDPPTGNNASLAGELNCFFTRFETKGSNNITTPPTSYHQSRTYHTATEGEVYKCLCTVNVKKTAGLDGIPGEVLRDFKHQLADVFTNIFNLSLSQATVPAFLKSATIIPVPKQSNTRCLNDYRAVALTPVITKCFERQVLQHVKSTLPIPV